MIWLWVLVPLIPVVLALVVWVFFLHDGDGAVFANALVAIILALVLLFPVIRQIGHNRGSAACYQYGRNIEREVRFFTNSYWDFDCYVHTNHGWVLRGNVTETELRNG